MTPLLWVLSVVMAQSKPGATTVKIGALAMKTSRLSVAAGILLAVDEINADTTIFPKLKLELKLNFSLQDGVPEIKTGTQGFLEQINWGARVIIGPPFSSQAVILAPLCQVFECSMISYLASRSSLSDKNVYPAFSRTTPPDHFVTRAMVKFLASERWSPLVVLVQNTDYGNGLLTDFAEFSGKSGIQIVTTVRISSSDPELRSQLKAIQRLPAKVIVHLGDATILLRTINATFELGLMGEKSGYLHCFSDAALFDYLWYDKSGDPFPWTAHSHGAATFAEGFPDLSPKYVDDLNRTAIRYFGEPLSLAEISGILTHLSAYTSIYLAAYSLNAMIETQETFKFSTSEFNQAARSLPSQAKIFDGKQQVGLDGNGDPYVSHFRVMNSVRVNGRFSWRSARNYELQSGHHGEVFFASTELIPFLYPDGSNKIPKLIPEIALSDNQGLVVAVSLIFIFISVMLFSNAALFFRYRTLPILRFTSSTFHLVFMTGLFFIAVSTIPEVSKPSPAAAFTSSFFLSLGTTVLLSSIVLKNYRIYKLLVKESEAMRNQTVLTDKDLLIRLSVIVALQLILLTIWGSVFKPSIRKNYVEGHYEWTLTLRSRGTAVLASFFVYVIPLLLMLSATIISILTRNVIEKKFNESVVAGTVIYSLALFAGFLGINNSFLLLDQNIRRNIASVFIRFFGVLAVFFLYSAKTTYYVISEAVLGKRLYDVNISLAPPPKKIQMAVSGSAFSKRDSSNQDLLT